ncbi:WD repeat-containing protein 19 [Halotydeus destructor]|nr:WD repeat-containing protein 19 [Halotydeus destructor]
MQRVYSVPGKTHGQGTTFFGWQRTKGSYLCTTGYDNVLNIHDRHGERVDQLNLTGFCVAMTWDIEGEVLAVITDRSPTVILWDSATRKGSRLDTGVRDPLTFSAWNKNGYLLAIGTNKGNILIYDHQTQRKIPILGKHSKRIIAGTWNDQNLLALISDDRTLTVSNKDGDTLCQTGLKGEPALPQFGSAKWDGKGNANGGENYVSLVLNRKTLFVMNVHDSELSSQINFHDRQGQIVDYAWLSDGLIIIGFSGGRVTVINAMAKDAGQELYSFTAHRDGLTSCSYCSKTKLLATCFENVFKIFSIEGDNDGEVLGVVTLEDEKAISWLEWNEEGQMLGMTATSGSVHVYLSKLPVIGDSFGTRMAYLSSLLEVTTLSVGSGQPVTVRIAVEPSIVAVGLYHLAVVMNNRVWFYGLSEPDEGLLVKEREYLGIIKAFKLNGDYAAALFTDGRLYLHIMDTVGPEGGPQVGRQGQYDDDEGENREVKMFPEGALGDKGRIVSHTMTSDMLIFATESGAIEFFLVEDWSVVNIYRHSCGIKTIAADPMGLRIIGLDEMNCGFVYNAVTDTLLEIPGEKFPATIKAMFWETFPGDKCVFVACDSRTVSIFAYASQSIDGPQVIYVDTMNIPRGQSPLFLYNGDIISQTESGKTSNFLLSTHDYADKMRDRSRLRDEYFGKVLKLRRHQDAWRICEYVDEPELWTKFGKAAMYDLDVELAIKIYRHTGESGMVNSLEAIKDVEEGPLLAGHMAVFLEQYELAQKLFLSSSRPQEALTLSQNMQDWDTALVLARRLAPHQVPFLSREYASQLEFAGDHHGALEHYERALTSSGHNLDSGQSQDESDQSDRMSNHNDLCRGGIARTAIRCGNTKRGLEFALNLRNDDELHLECAEILESMKLYSDAAHMFEVGGNFDKAAVHYLRVKNSSKVTQFLDKINSRETLLEYAKAKEKEHGYRDAMRAYLQAEDHIQVVRILLEHLNNPGEAVRIVRNLKSVEGARMVARFFQKLNDMSSAIEFLVMSKCHEEAFQLASSTGQMDIYANVLLTMSSEKDYQVPLADFNSIALFYEQDKSPLMAGKFYCLAHDYRKGVKLLLAAATLSATNETEAIRLVIDAASQCKEEAVIRQIIDYLIGELDGIPKDFKYLFRLYMSLGHYREAAKTAIIIAREEQNAGNYRNSHDLLFGMAQELQKQKIKIPAEMNSSLMLIHSYLLAKVWIKAGDHIKGAQLLIRVARNISRFPAHTVPILTSTVIECQKAGMKKLSVQFAIQLTKPEFREQIDPKFKRKIETLVRKSAGVKRDINDNENEPDGGSASPCPFCSKELPEIELNCTGCKNTIPFCIATGQHVLRDDMTTCNSCKFPAIMTHFLRYLYYRTVQQTLDTAIFLSYIFMSSISFLPSNRTKASRTQSFLSDVLEVTGVLGTGSFFTRSS